MRSFLNLRDLKACTFFHLKRLKSLSVRAWIFIQQALDISYLFLDVRVNLSQDLGSAIVQDVVFTMTVMLMQVLTSGLTQGH